MNYAILIKNMITFLLLIILQIKYLYNLKNIIKAVENGLFFIQKNVLPEVKI